MILEKYNISVLILIIFTLLSPCYSYYVTVDPHAEECFFERVKNGTKMSLDFEIVEGGFLDIDLSIVGPDGKVIHSGEREMSGSYTFVAYTPGAYTYCFSNKKTKLAPKIVMFNMQVCEQTKHETSKDGESTTKLEDMIRELNS